MPLRATEQGSRSPAAAAAAAADNPAPRPITLGGTGRPKRSAVAGLPNDALVEILSRLPAKSLCRSKCVSKACRDLIADRLRCRKLPHTLEGFFYGCKEDDDDRGYYDRGTKEEDISSDSEDDDETSSDSEDDDEEGGNDNEDEKLSHHVHGHFISQDNDEEEDGSSQDDDDDNDGSEDDDEEGSSEDDDEEGSSEDDDDDEEEEEEEDDGSSQYNDDYEDGSQYKTDYGDGSEDDDREGGSEDKKSLHRVHGHFVNLLGRPVPLVDPSFSVLRKQSGVRDLTLLDSCNGLLLFAYYPALLYDTPHYIVYNPATEHSVRVPESNYVSSPSPFGESEDEDSDDDADAGVWAYLIFDPVTSSHFQLIEFFLKPRRSVVQTYSSETKRWRIRRGERRRWNKGGECDLYRTMSSFRRGTTCFNSMLHLIVSPSRGPELIAAIDGNGKTWRVFRWPENQGFPVFVGQSEGLLHCITVNGHPDGDSSHMTELSIWVLADYDAEEWNLKHTVSFLELFGKKSCRFGSDCNVVTIHPDRNLVFFVEHWDYKLISYNMDLKEVDALCTVGYDHGTIAPYIPYFSETPVLSKKH